MYSEALLKRLRFSRRFRDCCFLLRRIWAIQNDMSFSDFWSKNKFAPITANYTLLEDLEAVCQICNISINPENLLLVLSCVKYRFAVRHIQKMPSAIQFDMERRAIAYGVLVRYLRNQMQRMLPVDKWEDTFLDLKINAITDWLELEGYGPYMKGMPNGDDGRKHAKFFFETQKLLSLAHTLLQLPEERNHNIRDRQTVRSYIFWRWRQQKLKYRQIADKWSERHPEDGLNDIDIVQKAVKKYQEEHGPKFTIQNMSRQEADEHWMNILQDEGLAPWLRLPPGKNTDWQKWIRESRQDMFSDTEIKATSLTSYPEAKR